MPLNEGPLFPTGSLDATTGALELFGDDVDELILDLLMRHSRGDWGEMDEFDAEANREAVLNDDRVFSSYYVKGEKVWVITEADRSRTTILLPEEY